MLRPHQIRQKGQIFRAWNSGTKRVLAQAATGSGKTVLAAAVALEILNHGDRLLYLVPSIEVLDQTRTKLERRNLRVSTYEQTKKQPLSRRCVLGTVQTFARRGDPIPGWLPTHIFVDEAHLMLDHLMRAVTRYPDAKVLCLTATPERYDGKSLAPIADVIFPGPPIIDMINAGWLCQMQLIRFSAPLRRKLSPAECFRMWKKHADGRMTIGFLRSKTMSKAVAAEFLRNGVPALHVDETAPKAVRSDALAALREGRIKALFNVGLFTQGLDIEPVSCVILERETQSVSRYLQMVGRGGRKSPLKQDCIVLDLASMGSGNHWAFGEPWIDREWSLTERNKPRKARSTKTNP